MQELEKILEEMKESSITVATSKEHYIHPQDGRFVEEVVLLDDVEKIIRKHINDGWIPVEERLPEVNADIEEIIEDDDCPEYNVTIRGASESTTLKYSPDGIWFDDNGYIYDVIAWRPMPEVYRPVDKTERSEGE